MGFLNKLGIGGGNAREAARVSSNGHSEKKVHNGTLAVGATRTPEAQETTRVSNGLKEFMWNLEGLGRERSWTWDLRGRPLSVFSLKKAFA